MPRIDFSNVDGIASFAPVPDGEYTCKISDIETDTTRAGDEMWRLRLAIEGGEHDGRLLFDNLVFSPKAMPRVKLLCESLGLDVTGVVSLEPAALLGRTARVTVYIEEYVDEHGTAKARNRIPFDGYHAVGASDDDCPF
ncbi:MAG TPA: DUF669 domain-containing protein [Candidatus Krumholzibacteria bacterium]|nr:DUF669 domain-containing protein [Candidatus Krumholzibacteria bacterium]HPD73313.1 DUF669 domain-containing protein [Candidatus Krumholzibacteria bacterium]HRY42029.1 DUF669 domain-containing protein [Candidatus Krumholzibacteria bacterium]